MNNMKLPDPVKSVNVSFNLYSHAGLLDAEGEVKQSVENLQIDSANT